MPGCYPRDKKGKIFRERKMRGPEFVGVEDVRVVECHEHGNNKIKKPKTKNTSSVKINSMAGRRKGGREILVCINRGPAFSCSCSTIYLAHKGRQDRPELHSARVPRYQGIHFEDRIVT